MDAIITAAGKNSRMQEDFKKYHLKPIHKLKLEINNKPILIHTIENVQKANIQNIIVAVGHYQDEIIQILKDYDMLDQVTVKANPDVEVGLSVTIQNCLKDFPSRNYLFMAADQPTVSTTTINKLIDTMQTQSNPKNTISILARKRSGHLFSAIGLGMPFCCYGNLLYNYLHGENGNLNPILRNMIKNSVRFYGVKAENKNELLNINHYDEYIKIKEIMQQ